MDAQGFLAALTPAVTDAGARERFLADPKAVLAAAGLDLPEWFTVTAREGDAAELTITVPALRDPDADLSDDDLELVAGGFQFGDLLPVDSGNAGGITNNYSDTSGIA